MATKLRKVFGRRVRELRRAKGLSLEALGERAGVNDKYVQSVETARQAPTLDVIEKLARGLDVKPAVLFADELPTVPRERVVKLLDQLGDEDMRRIAVVLEVFAGR